jgi:hypothetical protein
MRQGEIDPYPLPVDDPAILDKLHVVNRGTT